jgi:SAM-dependent methyltransferase
MERMLDVTSRAEERHFWFLGLRRNAHYMLARALDGRRVDRIVDCGAGTGRNLDWLQAFGPAVGLELTPLGLAIGRTRGRPLVRGTVTRLPFADESASLVTSFDVLYCLSEDDERAAVREMWRVLQPGGLALINVAALEILRGAHSTLTHERRRYSRRRLTALLNDAGFVIRRMTFTNMVTFPVTLAIRWLDRVSGRSATASDTEMRVPASPVNAIFDLALRAEWLLLHAMNLPVGTSLMCLAQKANHEDMKPHAEPAPKSPRQGDEERSP